MRVRQAGWMTTLAAMVLLACGGPAPTRTPPTAEPEQTATPRPVEATPSPVPTVFVDPNLHVNGMATALVDGLKQVVDPAHPNHNRRQNEQLGELSAGENVFLVDQARVHGDSYWQVARSEAGVSGVLGWIPQLKQGELTIDPYLPNCPTAFPLTSADLAALALFEGLSCFDDTELTLTGTVTCDRPTIDHLVGGATFLDGQRSCDLDDQFELLGDAVTSLLETPEAVETITGRYLVRGHFDDPEAHNCTFIPLGTSPEPPVGPPEPGAVAWCRQMFVVSTVVDRG